MSQNALALRQEWFGQASSEIRRYPPKAGLPTSGSPWPKQTSSHVSMFITEAVLSKERTRDNVTARHAAASAAEKSLHSHVESPGRASVLDILVIIGFALMLLGFAAALVPQIRTAGVLFPLGAALVAVAAYGARTREY